MYQRRAGVMLCERPAYRVIEQGIYVVGTIVVLAMLLAVPSLQRTQRDAAAKVARILAAENGHYCEKWGMAAGTDANLACIRDLIRIREETERRARDDDQRRF
jgi:hypothetical protein